MAKSTLLLMFLSWKLEKAPPSCSLFVFVKFFEGHLGLKEFEAFPLLRCQERADDLSAFSSAID